MISLTKSEIKFLSDYRKNHLSGLSVDTDNNVVNLDSREEIDDFLKQFFNSRGLKYTKPYVDVQRGIFAFKSVGMHTDYGSRKCRSLIFPLMGNGNLQHFTGKNDNGFRITETTFNSPSKYTKAIILNDQRPHSFISNSLCCALIISISNNTAKKLLTLENAR